MIILSSDQQSVVIDDVQISERIDVRVSRSGTLDGGCAIDNMGLSQSDRTFTVFLNIDEDQRDLILSIAGSGDIYISCEYGFFTGAISYIDVARPDASLGILIKDRIAEA